MSKGFSTAKVGFLNRIYSFRALFALLMSFFSFWVRLNSLISDYISDRRMMTVLFWTMISLSRKEDSSSILLVILSWILMPTSCHLQLRLGSRLKNKMFLAEGICIPSIRVLKHPILSISNKIIIRNYNTSSDWACSRLAQSIAFLFILFFNKGYKMNLTLSNQARSNRPIPFIQLMTPALRSSAQQLTPSKKTAKARDNCSGFFLSCMNAHQTEVSEENEVYQDVHLHKVREQHSPVFRSNLKSGSQPQRKHKISMSLNIKSNQYQTPTKPTHTNIKPKYLSEHKKIKTEQTKEQKVQLSHSAAKSKMMKFKTQPKKEIRKSEENMHQIKESSKPIVIASASSRRESENKSKLSLSNNFKSQMNQERAEVLEFKPKSSAIPEQISSDHVLIEDSFITARLANIYQRNSELQLLQKSNIVYYNKLMTNETLWRSPTRPQYNEITFSQPAQEFASTNKYDFKDVSIQKDIPQELNEKESEEEINIKKTFKERRWIGEYAKTIKTFNESELRSNDLNSEAESIVLERGYNQFNQQGVSIMPFNRGSIKQYKEEGTTQRRGYGSVGQDFRSMNVTHPEHRFTVFVSQTIEEDLYDSENFEAKQ